MPKIIKSMLNLTNKHWYCYNWYWTLKFRPYLAFSICFGCGDSGGLLRVNLCFIKSESVLGFASIEFQPSASFGYNLKRWKVIANFVNSSNDTTLLF